MTSTRVATRRTFLFASIGAVAAGAAASQAALAATGTCADLDKLAATGLRRSLNFRPVAPDPNRTCKGCTFFRAGTETCGSCVLLSGGAVSPGSVCDSWAAKAG
ncbi:high-potential iron-sulfur protein [Novosphingobium bradum]|uniref:High-potential iron-sulfur protein n=1 Tax=Novosphingobium bradum TaxID=1737444 RepID=A0ABV7IQ33_9SPHN